MRDDRGGVARRLLARVADDGDAQRLLEGVGLVPLRVVLLQPGRVGQERELRPASRSVGLVSFFGKGARSGGERRRRGVGELERVRDSQRVVLVEDGGLEARSGEGAPVEARDVADGEVREEERGRRGGLFDFFIYVEVEFFSSSSSLSLKKINHPFAISLYVPHLPTESCQTARCPRG